MSDTPNVFLSYLVFPSPLFPLKHSIITNMAVPHLLGVDSSHRVMSHDRLTLACSLVKLVHDADSQVMEPTGMTDACPPSSKHHSYPVPPSGT